MMALRALQERADVRVRALLSTFWEPENEITMHGTPESMIRAQAESLGLPLISMQQPRGASNEMYERLFAGALQPLINEGVSYVAAGDLHLEDVRSYREGVIQRAGATPLFPIWSNDTMDLAHRVIDDGFRVVITSIDEERIPACLLGTNFDHGFLEKLPGDVDPCGEHGEFHTFVAAGPGFSRPVPFRVEDTRAVGPMTGIGLSLRENAT